MTPGALWRALRGSAGPRFRSREALERYQSACLRALIHYAYQQVPYFRWLLDDCGVSPGQIRNVANLSLLPTTDRSDIQMLPAEDVCAKGLLRRAHRVLSTSGSSGAPLVVRRTELEETLMLAFRARAVGAWGFGPRTRRANIDHFSPETLAMEARQRFYERLGIILRLNLDWRTPKDEIVARISHFEPDLISGPPSLLAELADDLDDSDRERIHATRILTGAEQLSESARERIERGFGLPVADIYGCTEIVFMAMEAPDEEGYRLCEEAVIVEVLNGGAPADRGEIFVTGLHQWSMPFIRYRLGDFVEVMDGTGVHRFLRSIDGRVTDRFLLSDGRRLHGYTLGELVEGSRLAVRRFQITQVQRDAFHVRLVLDAADRARFAALDQCLRDTLGPGIQVQLEVVESLDRADRKFHTFVSYERLQKLSAAGSVPEAGKHSERAPQFGSDPCNFG